MSLAKSDCRLSLLRAPPCELREAVRDVVTPKNALNLVYNESECQHQS